MMETVPHVTSGSGLRKFQADGFSLDRVYLVCPGLLRAVGETSYRAWVGFIESYTFFNICFFIHI